MTNCKTLNSLYAITLFGVLAMGAGRLWNVRLLHIVTPVVILWIINIWHNGSWSSLRCQTGNRRDKSGTVDWMAHHAKRLGLPPCQIAYSDHVADRIAVLHDQNTGTPMIVLPNKPDSSFGFRRQALQAVMHILHRDFSHLAIASAVVLILTYASHLSYDRIISSSDFSAVTLVAQGIGLTAIHIFLLASLYAYMNYLVSDAKQQSIRIIALA